MRRVLVSAAIGLTCLVTVSRTCAIQCLPPPAGLVAWWGGEYTPDDRAGTNNGTLLGNASYAPGIIGNAFSFDGWSGSMLVPDAPELRFTDAATIEAWVHPTAYGTGFPCEIVSKWFGNGDQCSYTTSIDTSGKAYFLVSGDGIASHGVILHSTHIVPLNQWTHFAATYDGVELRVYLNGVLEGQAPWTNGLFAGTAPLVIGSTTLASVFHGLIDEPAVYGRVLSADEIAALYNAGSAGKCAAPFIKVQPRNQVGYWGKSVTFTVSASGAPPLTYQWLKHGGPIADATGSSLLLTNLQMTDADSYSVIVSNSLGSVTSSNAYLTMNPAGVSLALYPGITIDGVVGLTYGIQCSTNLSNTNAWWGLANVTLGAPIQLWFDLQPASRPQRYYRVVPGPISIP